MRFAARGKFKFMQMEVGMGILPCGGGASRMARQVGLGRALEIIIADENGMEHDMANQRNWNDLVISVQDIKQGQTT